MPARPNALLIALLLASYALGTVDLDDEDDGALVATSFIGTWAQPTTPEP